MRLEATPPLTRMISFAAYGCQLTHPGSIVRRTTPATTPRNAQLRSHAPRCIWAGRTDLLPTTPYDCGLRARCGIPKWLDPCGFDVFVLCAAAPNQGAVVSRRRERWRVAAIWSSVRRATLRIGWGVADQGMSSFTNFAANIYVARALGAVEYGAFALAFVTYSFALNASRGLATDPLLVRFSGTDAPTWRRAVASCTGTATANRHRYGHPGARRHPTARRIDQAGVPRARPDPAWPPAARQLAIRVLRPRPWRAGFSMMLHGRERSSSVLPSYALPGMRPCSGSSSRGVRPRPSVLVSAPWTEQRSTEERRVISALGFVLLPESNVRVAEVSRRSEVSRQMRDRVEADAARMAEPFALRAVAQPRGTGP